MRPSNTPFKKIKSTLEDVIADNTVPLANRDIAQQYLTNLSAHESAFKDSVKDSVFDQGKTKAIVIYPNNSPEKAAWERLASSEGTVISPIEVDIKLRGDGIEIAEAAVNALRTGNKSKLDDLFAKPQKLLESVTVTGKCSVDGVSYDCKIGVEEFDSDGEPENQKYMMEFKTLHGGKLITVGGKWRPENRTTLKGEFEGGVKFSIPF